MATKKYTVPTLTGSTFNYKDTETMCYGSSYPMVGIDITNNSASTGIITDNIGPSGTSNKNYKVTFLGTENEPIITPQTSTVKKTVYYKIK